MSRTRRASSPDGSRYPREKWPSGRLDGSENAAPVLAAARRRRTPRDAIGIRDGEGVVSKILMAGTFHILHSRTAIRDDVRAPCDGSSRLVGSVRDGPNPIVAATKQFRSGRRGNGRQDMKRFASALVLCGTMFGASGVALAAGLDELPPEVQKSVYSKDMIDPQQPIGPSAYRDWKPKKGPPWTIGYASSYAGNTWRAAAHRSVEKELIPKWKKLGLDQGRHRHPVQPQGFRSDPADAAAGGPGVDALIICCSNPTALNQTVKYAYDKGVPTLLHGRLCHVALCGQFVHQFRRHRQHDGRLAGQRDRQEGQCPCR